MNRREFLLAAGAVVAAPILPALASPPDSSRELAASPLAEYFGIEFNSLEWHENLRGYVILRNAGTEPVEFIRHGFPTVRLKPSGDFLRYELHGIPRLLFLWPDQSAWAEIVQ